MTTASTRPGPTRRDPERVSGGCFCGACGTALAFLTTDEPGWVDVTVGSMDRAEQMAPHDHIWTSDRLPWLVLDDDLPRLARGHR